VALVGVALLFLLVASGQSLLAQEEEPGKKNESEADPATPVPKPDPSTDKPDEENGKETDKDKKPEDEHLYPFHTDDRGVPLDRFINWASHALGIPFYWTSQARQQSKGPQKMVIVTEEMKIPRSVLLDFVRTALRVHKLALVPVGPKGAEFILIEHLDQPTIIQTRRVFVPASEIEKYKDSYIPIVTTVHVEHVNVQQIQTQIQRLNPTATAYGAAIIPAPSENAFIIVDFGPEVYNLVRLIKEMDKEGIKFDQTLEIINLQFADPGEMETILSEILQDEGGGLPGQPGVPQQFPGGAKQPPAPKIIPDERANRLVVWAVPEDHKKIRELVDQLDTDVPPSTGRVTVYQLKNSVAEDLVETLKEIMEGSSGTSRRGGGPTQGSLQTSTGSDKIDIVADKGANAVLIRGTKTRVTEVIEIIKELDVRKPQVLVEAAILELQHDNSIDLGVELGAFDAKDDLSNTFRPFAYTNLGLSVTTVSESGIFRVPLVGNQGVIGGIFDGDGFLFPVLIRAFQAKGYTNLLSMPSVLTNDNQEATIRVARSVPYAQLNQGAPGQVSTQTFGDYAEAPIELSISPHISSGDYLRLEIRFLVEVFGVPSASNSSIPPPKTAREINTAVTVPNGATVVIGGLTLDDQTETTSQVPILGDIPILGFLFRSTSTRQQKNTLYLFLTPRILTDPQFRDLDEISTRKKAEIAALKGQVDLVDPEFGRRFRMLDPARTIEDVERTGVFDRPYIHSPLDEQLEAEAAKKNDVTGSSSRPKMKAQSKGAPPSGKSPGAGSGDVIIEPAPAKTTNPPADG
jgi:general secretion pathway protein D